MAKSRIAVSAALPAGAAAPFEWEPGTRRRPVAGEVNTPGKFS
ncbi:MAG TPA: hypothetical protein VGB65_11505 [Allosphingosinicella sp.]|jgi:hypothetical protein